MTAKVLNSLVTLLSSFGLYFPQLKVLFDHTVYETMKLGQGLSEIYSTLVSCRSNLS